MHNGTVISWKIVVVCFIMFGAFYIPELCNTDSPDDNPYNRYLFTEPGTFSYEISDSLGQVVLLESNIESNILLEQANLVRHFNETLNRQQNDTMTKIVYVLAFISAVAVFFGYKTMRDIRETAKGEIATMSDFYTRAFDTLQETATISKEIVVSSRQSVKEILDETTQKLKKHEEKLEDTEKRLEKAKIKINEYLGLIDKYHMEEESNIKETSDEARETYLGKKDSFFGKDK